MSELGALFYASAFSVWGSPVTWLEIVAFALSIVMVVLNMRVDARAWPLAIASSLLYFALFWNSRLYGDASLQLFFVAVAAWGWKQWLGGRSGAGPSAGVRRLGERGRVGIVVATLVGWPALGLFLRRYTDTDVPWWDAFPTTLSLVGQWLLGRKYIENWPVWIVVNVASVALFVHKGLWLTVVLYGVFVAMSFAGWRAWERRVVRG